MHPNQRACLHQQQRVCRHAANSDSYAFFNLLTGPELLEPVETLLPDHRERLFPPTETLSMFLAQAMSADRSCQKAVDEAAIKRLNGGLALCSTHTGAYCRARQRLPLEMVATLARHTGCVMAERTPPTWHWRGRAVRLVDGATVALPDTPENQALYPQPSSQQPGLGSPLCRVVGILCLASGALLDAAMGPCRGKGSDEQSLLRSMLDTLAGGDILLGDAFYATYFLLCALQERGVDGVFEQQGSRRRSTDFRRGKRLGPRDHLIELRKPKIKPTWMSQADYDQAPDVLKVRELYAGGKILMTTLLCPKQTSKAALKGLYRDRLACRAGSAQHQDHLGYGAVELPHTGDGTEGDLGLSVGLQPDPTADGSVGLIGRGVTASAELQTHPANLDCLAAERNRERRR